MQVEKGFFVNKICLDAGCGSNANATYAMLSMGAKKVYCFDLDSSIYETIPNILSKFNGRYELGICNVLNMKYPDNFFDFVHCAGVLHSTHNPFKGLKELARVTKKSGILYIHVTGKGGLITDITDFLRRKYTTNDEFKSFIKDISPASFEKMFRFIFTIMEEKEDKYANKISPNVIKELFDKDLILTIRDRIQTPIYHQIPETKLIDWLRNNGFSNIQRLSRYPKYKNIRRFLSPFYDKYDNKFSRFLYGDGNIQIKAIKN